MLGKKELVDLVAQKGLTKADATKAVDAVVEGITAELTKGGEVSLKGFLGLKVITKKARTGRNPKTGAEIKIPAMKAVSVKVGKALKEAVRG